MFMHHKFMINNAFCSTYPLRELKPCTSINIKNKITIKPPLSYPSTK